jgi:ADP-ribose pyrophosphatase YjhB (NUDIX family)
MELPEIKHFNIRVYALILNDAGDILLSDEYVLDTKMTKFPGGGMHFGEGPADCIRREALEEFGQEIEIVEHFYTTDFFQRALFYAEHQLISIYYRARFKEPPTFKISGRAFDFPALVNGSQSFRWCNMDLLDEEDLTFPIDKHVLGLLKKSLKR